MWEQFRGKACWERDGNGHRDEHIEFCLGVEKFNFHPLPLNPYFSFLGLSFHLFRYFPFLLPH